MKRKLSLKNLGLMLIAMAALVPAAQTRAEDATRATVTVQADAPGTRISPDLFGIFFEDINYAADGGLYAELVQNRSFEYNATEGRGWNALTAWQLVTRGNGQGSLSTANNAPLNAHQPSYAVLTVEQGGSGVGLANSGFDGIPLKSGDQYDVSFFARQFAGQPAPLSVRLESKTGVVYGETTFAELTPDWKPCRATLQASATDPDARLVLLTTGTGELGLSTVSLFPQKTFHNRPNGLRADLAQVIADLHPKFVRFPGGCLVHGYGLNNIYHWKDTIGPIEDRKEQRNIWHYHQSVGLGYFEYFQFCEDIGAKPLPIQAAGVCCQNSPGGQHGVPMDQMAGVAQDVLDLIEYANGPANSTWGAKRAAAGHPAPFHLEYIGVGNEDAQTPEFGIRFKMIYDAVRAKHPEITVVGTVGPAPAGSDYDEGWKFASDLGVDMVDEHYYEKPEWFLANLHRYDTYRRAGPKVYVGEYASWGNSLANALAEAAYMTSLERNGDVVRMASYAPLLGRENHMQWKPNLIYFNNSTVCPSVNYYVQRLFSQNQGDVYLPTTVASSLPGLRRSGFLLGAWDTQVEYKDLKVVAGGQTLVNESFDGAANHWVADSGVWHIQNGAYVQSANGEPNLAKLTTMIEATDYTLTLKAKKTGGQEGFLIGFGVQDARNYYWWNLGGWGNTGHAIERVSNGAKVTLGTQVEGGIDLNRWYDLKIEVAAGRIKCYLDNVLINEVVDEAAAGSSGLVASCVKDTSSGDVILKLVNVTAMPVQGQINFAGGDALRPAAIRTVLTGEPKAEDTFAHPQTVLPAVTDYTGGPSFTSELAPYSLTVVRMKTR
jgi:alpha-L-arabinofuranosidase